MIAAQNKKEKYSMSIDFRYLHESSFRFVSASLVSIYLIFFLLYKYEPLLTIFWRSVLGMFPALFAFFAWRSMLRKRYVSLLFLSFSCVFTSFLYVFVVFSVDGRINAVVVPLAVAIVLSMLFPSRGYKIGLVLLFPLGLILAGFHRAMQRE